MLRQQFKQYIHHHHYMSISGKTIHSENALITYQFRSHYCYHSYDVDASYDVEQEVLRVAILTSFLKG